MSERDTHFIEASLRLVYEISLSGYIRDDADTTISRFLYDRSLYVMECVPADKRSEWGDPIDCIEHIPDRNTWPLPKD